MARGFKTIEKKYGVKVVIDDIYYSPFTGKSRELFKMYSADGCCWEKGLSREGVKKEVAEWGDSLLKIKKNVENR